MRATGRAWRFCRARRETWFVCRCGSMPAAGTRSRRRSRHWRDGWPPRLRGPMCALVEPEGLELALWCPKDGLARCFDRLRRGLSLRAPAAPRLAAARTRLVAARRRAEAADPGRAADRLALRALYGEAAEGLVPLGAAREDSAASAAQIRAFLADHFGPNRALLVAIGEVDERGVVAAADRGLGGAPRARAARASARPQPAESGVQLDIDSRGALSLALAGPDLGAVQAAAAALRERLGREQLALQAGPAHAFRLRGNAL